MWAYSILDRLSGDQLIPIVAIGGGILAFILTTLAHSYRKLRETQVITELKRDLIAQGRSTDEIERICNAGLKKNSKAEC